jgi:omega-6 fatty acid desaturase (delta-12 desaturase)
MPGLVSGDSDAKNALAAYARPRLGRSLLDLATSVVPYIGLTAFMYVSLGWNIGLTLGLAVPTAAFLLRTFIVFHDCGHGSFFASKRANRWVGRFTALLVWQPYENWRFDHAVHHGTAGDLDRRGQGDVPTWTVDEYYTRPWQHRLGYRLFRNPLVMFGLGPLYSLMIAPRFSSRAKRRRLRNSIILTNLALAAAITTLCLLFGIPAFLLVQLVPAYLAAMAGVWLFYVQHQFEDVYWETGERWSYTEAALEGSSYLKLPQPLQFFTGNIGLHHVHHLNARVPNYNLQAAHDENEIFAEVPVLTLRDSLRCPRLKLIDPARGRLVTWAEARALVRAPTSRPATARI